MAFCESLITVIFIIANAGFFISGVMIFGIGLWVKLDKELLFDTLQKIKLNETTSELKNISPTFLDVIASILIVLGIIALVTGFCGCCGAIQRNQLLLYTYIFIVSFIVVSQVSIGIYVRTKQNQFLENLEDFLQKCLKHEFNGILSNNPTPFTRDLTMIMIKAKCCGLHKESDFNINNHWKQNISGIIQKHPVGCCKLKDKFEYDPDTKLNYTALTTKMEDPHCPTKLHTELNNVGCLTLLNMIIKYSIGIIMGFCFGLALIEILCIVFACGVARKKD